MIDVAVPVYGNEPLVRRCLESVFAHTPEPHRLLVIDDASPDPGLRRALEDLDEEGKILLFRNPENRGFVSTVNRAFRMTANDVVALNSDTVVTPGWLGKMARCAASRPRVASVTPLTNNGTICAVPRWNEPNPIPEGLSLNEWAGRIEIQSRRRYPDLPTGVGFCMLPFPRSSR